MEGRPLLGRKALMANEGEGHGIEGSDEKGCEHSMLDFASKPAFLLKDFGFRILDLSGPVSEINIFVLLQKFLNVPCGCG